MKSGKHRQAHIMSSRAARAHVGQVISAARVDGYVVHVECYCNNTQCLTREVSFRLKDYDGVCERGSAFEANGRALGCPWCGEPLAVHSAESFAQHQTRYERQARWSVNSQMRYRDHVAVNGSDSMFAEDASELCDDRLPPTPDGWFVNRGAKGKPRTFVVRSKPERQTK